MTSFMYISLVIFQWNTFSNIGSDKLPIFHDYFIIILIKVLVKGGLSEKIEDSSDSSEKSSQKIYLKWNNRF